VKPPLAAIHYLPAVTCYKGTEDIGLSTGPYLRQHGNNGISFDPFETINL
jgi:hypothetical protein